MRPEKSINAIEELIYALQFLQEILEKDGFCLKYAIAMAEVTQAISSFSATASLEFEIYRKTVENKRRDNTRRN